MKNIIALIAVIATLMIIPLSSCQKDNMKPGKQHTLDPSSGQGLDFGTAIIDHRFNDLAVKDQKSGKAYTAMELITSHQKSKGSVSDSLANAMREAMLDKLIEIDQGSFPGKNSHVGQDTTGVNCIFQNYALSSSLNQINLHSRIKVFNGSFTPPIYSMCFILRSSHNLVIYNSKVSFELASSFIDFPPLGPGHQSVIYNAVGNTLYLVFFDYIPFNLTWADKVICESTWVKTSAGPYWFTIDRSDDNNFALSSNGYDNYVTYFFPDTLNVN